MSCHIRRSDCFLQCYLMTILHQSHQRAQDSNKLQILFGKRFATYFFTEFNNVRALTRVRLGKWTSTTDRWGPFSEDLFRWFKYPVLRPDLLIAPSGQKILFWFCPIDSLWYCFQRGDLFAMEDYLWRKIWTNCDHEYYSDRFERTKSKRSRIFLKSTPCEQIQTPIKTNSGNDWEASTSEVPDRWYLKILRKLVIALWWS